MFDFGVGYSELFVLALIAVLVIGPKDLPKVLRTFGQFMAKARGMAREFQGHVDAAMKDSGLDEIKKEAQGLKSTFAAPNVMGNTIAAAQAKQSNDFDAVFGKDATPGETRVGGKTIDASSTPAT
jgi:sec-independent protein translocase protein TatB